MLVARGRVVIIVKGRPATVAAVDVGWGGSTMSRLKSRPGVSAAL